MTEEPRNEALHFGRSSVFSKPLIRGHLDWSVVNA